MAENVKKVVVVTGDATIDWLQWDIKPKEEKNKEDKPAKRPNWELYPGYHMEAAPGGSLLMAKMFQDAMDAPDDPENPDETVKVPYQLILQEIEKKIENIPPDEMIHSITMLDGFKDPSQECVPKKIYQVKEFRGFSGPENQFPPSISIKGDEADADIVIIDDAGNGYRNGAGKGNRDDNPAWPLAIKENKSPIVVLKMSRPLANGELWKKLIDNHSDKLIVVLNANDLRDHGVKISRHLSWERTALDFMWEIENNPIIEQLKDCKNLIVRFGIDGAIYYKKTGDNVEAVLYYDPKVSEDGYRDNQEGDMQGFGCVFVAAIAAQITKKGIDELDNGVKNGIISSRRLLDHGFGEYPDESQSNSEKDEESSEEHIAGPHYPGIEIFGNYGKDESEDESEQGKKDEGKPESNKQEKKESKENKCEKEGPIFKIELTKNTNNKFWTILESKTRWKLESVAKNYVLNGDDSQLNCVPVGAFGALKTVDRTEIESYQSIRNLMKEYLERDNQDTPLCIAVFGPPGSGKSFGVTQLADSIAPKKVKKLEFNVAQFESSEDLTDVFHLVRDEVLKGKVPLVFFDEFDCTFEKNKLGWLKYFLAPMNDGEFKDGDCMHPIGKSIFVFAGGTSNNFKKFAREEKSDEKLIKTEEKEKNETEEERKKREKQKKRKEKDLKDFRSAKGTDFISRLRGHVNVIGPNRNGAEDAFYMIRRALFLRSIIERKAKNLLDREDRANIDPGVLRGLLKVPRYKHGVRSMEAIIEMSMLTNRKKFEQAALPPEEQLEMHVDAWVFFEIVSRDVLFASAMEKLAQEVHEEYRRSQKGIKDPNDPAMQPWEKLDEKFKESNRQQAQSIPEKLQRVHYDFLPALSEVKDDFELKEEEIEILAEMEHERWNEERFKAGWTLGTTRSSTRRTSPYLIPWSELPNDVQEWDRNTVKKIPELLKKAGFEIYSLK